MTALAVLVALVGAMFAVVASSQTGPRITSTTDSDFTISEGGNITVSVSDPGDATYTFQPIFGFVLSGTAANGPATYTHQAGAPTGEFKIRATSPGTAPLEKTLEVGEAGDNLASISVNLGTTNADGTARGTYPTPADGDKAETDTAPSGTIIYIEVEAKNGLGNASDVSADNSLTVVVFAVGGTVAAGDTAAAADSGSSATGTSDGTVETVAPNKVNFNVFSANAGKVEVFATATIGTSSVRTTESLILNFSGGPDMISAGDASGGLLAPKNEGDANTGVISFEVTSVDKAEATNSAQNDAGDLVLDPADISTGFKITNADDEDVTSKFTVDYSAKGDAAEDDDDTTSHGSTDIDESKISENAIAVVITPGAAPGVPGGTYTATVTLDEGSKNSVEVNFNVVGPLDSLAAAADSLTVVEDGEFTVTATLLDANGLPVADGKPDVAAAPTATPPVVAVDNTADDVVFSVIGGDLNVWGQDSTEKGQVVAKEVKGGTASATFYVTGDSGKAIVLVRVGTKTARVTVSTEAPVVDPDAPAAAAISLSTDAETHDAGLVMVTAMVTDANGDSVADGMPVRFYVLGDAEVFGPTMVYTSDGTASAIYNASDNFSVLATSGQASGRSEVDVISAAEQAAADQAEADRIAAEEADAQAERDRIAAEEAAAAADAAAAAAAAAADAAAAEVAAETERLTGMNGFVSWLSESPTTASELFSSLSAAGATAIHLWNDGAWVRYSVVDGSAVPGSVNFDVERGDILFISN
ncbi:MAG: hypothetical protein OXC29_04335 [Rhodococcus sp.]|nr:hypothetical protein [Rhodococcus sp. (in: high G+C Gram-positive bacteria)]